MPRFVPVVMLLAATMLAADAGAGERNSPSILTRSPFLPPGFQPPGGPGAAPSVPPARAGQYEFRGVYQLGGAYFFNVFNKQQGKGLWIGDDAAAVDGSRIISFDLDADTVVVEINGEQLSLQMIETSNQPMPVATAPTAPQPTPAVSQPAPATRPATTPVRRRVIRPTGASESPGGTPTPVRRTISRPTLPTANP